MKSADLRQLLQRLSGYSPTEMDQRSRPLRNAGLINYGPRGRHAPDMSDLDTIMYLLSMVSRSAKDVAQVTKRAFYLPAVPHETRAPNIGVELGLFVAGFFTPDSKKTIHQIEIACDGSFAWADFEVGGHQFRVLFSDRPGTVDWVRDNPDAYDNQYAHYAGHTYIIRGGVIEQIRLKMFHPTEGGWVGDEKDRGSKIKAAISKQHDPAAAAE